MISSLVRVGRFDAVKQALSKINVVALSVLEARDYAPQSHGTRPGWATCTLTNLR
jgi:nitrogen regulatory protein PII